MAINISQAFHRTSGAPIDDSIALTKAQMLNINDNLMPQYYFTICQDDGKFYIYNKSNTASQTTGKFRVLETGGSTNPTGTIISFMGVNAPDGYLKCDGSSYNTTTYANLANFFEAQFGSKYKFGGSGTSFKVPNLKGEFLRCTGTNSHTIRGVAEGSGDSVGTHQSSTLIPNVTMWNSTNTNCVAQVFTQNSDGQIPISGNFDAKVTMPAKDRILFNQSSHDTIVSDATPPAYTARPTNTSVWYCIKY